MPESDQADLPTGTVTFLFTDVEGSTRLLEQQPAAYREAVAYALEEQEDLDAADGARRGGRAGGRRGGDPGRER
jgi:hypothetical protein